MIIDEDAYLQHHGVKGQRWGVRRRRDITSGLAAAGAAWLAASFVGKRTMNSPLTIAVGAAAGIGTYKKVHSFLEKDFDKSFKSIK